MLSEDISFKNNGEALSNIKNIGTNEFRTQINITTSI